MRDNVLENPEAIQVELKPFAGLPPTIYLPALYGFVLVVIIFLLLILPALVRPGTILTVVSSPPHAAVTIDGIIRGASGEGIFARAGTRSLVVSKPGFVDHGEELNVGRRIVGSLFFPRRRNLIINLVAVSAEALIESAVLSFSSWSLVGEASGQYQFPPVARELGVDLAASGSAPQYRIFSEVALAHLNSEAQMNDLLAGALLAEAGGGPPGPLSLATVMQHLATISEGAPGFPTQLVDITSGRRNEILSESPWLRASAQLLFESQGGPRVPMSEVRAETRTLGGLVFLEVPAGSGLVGGADRAERGGEIAYAVDLDSFLVSQAEVTVETYSRFLSEMIEWSPGFREGLVNQGLVDADYLRDWVDGVPSATLPVRNVSAHAADAFAAWFSTQIVESGLTARLPSEAEWDYLSSLDRPEAGVFATSSRAGPSPVGASMRGSLGLFGLVGNLWEWTVDPFATYDRYHTGARESLLAGQSVHRVVRGGGWATPAGGFLIDDRGSMPPDWSSGAVGFRIVLTEQ